MTENKAFPKFKKHLVIFIILSLLLFLAMFFSSLLFIVFDEPTEFFRVQLPGFIHYLGIFISFMMMVMGATYLRFLKKQG